MGNFIHVVLSCLPLSIESVFWDGDSLLLSSGGWYFRTESAWRVSREGEMQFACWDEDAGDLINGLAGLSVVGVDWVICGQPIDPSMKLSDGRKLDVFCSTSIEPWVMSLPDGSIYVGNS
jgi:hypothetical protein